MPLPVHRTIYFVSTGDIAEKLEQGVNHAINSYINTQTKDQAQILKQNLSDHPLPFRHQRYQNPYFGMALMFTPHRHALDQNYGYSDFVSIIAQCVFPCLGLSNDASHITLTCPVTQDPVSYDNLDHFTKNIINQLLKEKIPYSPHITPTQREIGL